jgi:hypothetical protein
MNRYSSMIGTTMNRTTAIATTASVPAARVTDLGGVLGGRHH